MEQKDGDNPMGEDEAGRSAKGRIPVIKIRIPKKVEEEDEARSHYCKECNKSFNSGKALGGHMSSAHVQANNLKKLSSNSKRKSPSSSAANACMHCGRVFQSQKSLFGHMRCHPEREWRGMEPPPEMKINFSEEEEEEEEELGFFNVKGWPTSKRGRAPVSSNSDSEAFVAGFKLMKMLKEDEIKKPAVEEKQESEELYMTAIEVLMSGKRERDKYKCSECGRVFSTHQALGGHRSSHNKFKMTLINTNATSTTTNNKKINENILNTDAAANDGGAFAFDLNTAPSDEDEDMVDS